MKCGVRKTGVRSDSLPLTNQRIERFKCGIRYRALCFFLTIYFIFTNLLWECGDRPGNESEPAADFVRVSGPLFAKLLRKLLFFPSHHPIHNRQVRYRQHHAGWSAEHERSPQEHKDVPAKIERMPRKTVGAVGDERLLCGQYNDFHVVLIEMIRRPDS
jgi:hypothetical protein